MPLAPGETIGPYKVVAPLGEGAMGIVFRARETRLQRDVALKLLPDRLAHDPDRLSRLEREAQLLASLNHANIAQIYGFEQTNGSACIVMELVEGETLAERLKRGALPYEEAVEIAKQIASALQAAHERAIVHRDLKPANIKLTPNGTVKVLDFGLAKALGDKASDIGVSAMLTVASASVPGTIVGTPTYMSPEQARGKEVDARTDVWAFGCVLYEMLTGQQVFEAETITDVLAKIVTSPPDLDRLPQNTPSSIRLLLTVALAKNVSQRLQHIGDARMFLDGTLASHSPVSDAPKIQSNRRTIAIVSLAAVAAIAAISAAVAVFQREPEAAPMHLELSFPDIVGTPIVSPDGKAIAFTAQPSDGKRALWVRPIVSDVAQRLAGTEDVAGVLWSPDSRRLAFLADGKLKRVDAAGGPIQTLADVGPVRGAAWNRAGVILVARGGDAVIAQLRESGGALTPVTTLDRGRNESLHGAPVFLPDGRRFLYVALASKPEASGIFLSSLDSGQTPTRVLSVEPRNFNGMAYASGHLLIMNEGRLTAQRLSADGMPEGESVVLAESVGANFSVSDTGLLIFRKAAPLAGKQLVWFDREGKQVGRVGPVANYGNVDLSPGGDRAAVDINTNNNRDIWVVDLARAVSSRITFDPASDWTASWSPDGSRLAFASGGRNNGTVTQIFQKSSNGAGTESMIPAGDRSAIPVHWSADGRYIAFSRLKSNANSSYDTWLVPASGDGQPQPLLESPFDKFNARVSPDNRFVAYVTNETGIYEIVVQTFPETASGKWQISAGGGIEPKWRHDGRELYYLAFDGKLMSVPITGPDFQAGRPVALFQTPLAVNPSQPTRDRRYDVSSDGRFLIVTPAADAASMPSTVIVNWMSAFDIHR